jgi:hypothetical protein
MLRLGWFVFGVTCLSAFASGCSVWQAAHQPDKKDMGVLYQGTPRLNVIAELGTPVWSEQSPEGATTDVFTFKQGYSEINKTGRALFHGAADVATMGLWEVVGTPAEMIADGTDVQLQVRYDAYQNVETVQVLKGAEAVHGRNGLR